MAPPTLVIATRNPGKIRELEALLADSGVRLLSLADFPHLPEIPEEGATFAENAAAKALAVARLTHHPALADDSGLMVDALGGAPGVFSARYAQDRTAPRPPTDADNWGKLLDELKDVPWEARGARFVCELDEQGKVKGLTGQKGLSEYIADHFPEQVMVQRVGGQPGMGTREGA